MVSMNHLHANICKQSARFKKKDDEKEAILGFFEDVSILTRWTDSNANVFFF